ncbi:MAG: DUF937 domain-containing protein [Promicromonosporaceae bacterium]|nr:DUF937 domain-containing protein [Promicromonosporaceae bacterium]
MAGLDELLSSLPLDQIAGKLGVDPGTAQTAASGLLPALVGGLQANAADPAGAASISQALTQHSSSLVDGGVNLADVDDAEGAKIAHHIFGAQQDQVVAKVAETTGTEPGVLQKLLPTLAPIVMSYLSKQVSAGPQASGAQAQQGGGGIGGLLGNLFGGHKGDQAGAAGAGGTDLGGVLGSILGGGGSGGAGGGLDVGSLLGGLGGLLGGGRR